MDVGARDVGATDPVRRTEDDVVGKHGRQVMKTKHEASPIPVKEHNDLRLSRDLLRDIDGSEAGLGLGRRKAIPEGRKKFRKGLIGRDYLITIRQHRL